MATTAASQKTDAKDEAKDEPKGRARDEKKASTQRQRGTRADKQGALGGNGALIGAAAAGVAVGVGLMIGRKLAVQAPTALAGDWDQALAAEHKAVMKIFDALEASSPRATGRRKMMVAQLKHALAKHALQEENTVYPALRDHGSTEGADQLNHEHGYVKQYLYELGKCPPESSEFLAIVSRFRADIEKHVREEEDALFPALKAKLSEKENKALTAAMNMEGLKLA